MIVSRVLVWEFYCLHSAIIVLESCFNESHSPLERLVPILFKNNNGKFSSGLAPAFGQTKLKLERKIFHKIYKG